MGMPQELRAALENQLNNSFDLVSIDIHAKEISKRYRLNDNDGKRLVTQKDEAIAYALSRMPATYESVYETLSKIIENNEFEINTVLGINIERSEVSNYETVPASTDALSTTSKIGKIDYKLNLFGGIPLKDITVNVIPKATVVPLGNTVGLKLYTSGVLVVGMSEIEGVDNIKYRPYENTGIKEGDMLIEANGTH